MRSLTPAVQPGDPDWRDYYGMLQQSPSLPPNAACGVHRRFLCGGVSRAGAGWIRAGRAFERLTELNRGGRIHDNGINGETLQPMGVACQAFGRRGMYLLRGNGVLRSDVRKGLRNWGGRMGGRI